MRQQRDVHSDELSARLNTSRDELRRAWYQSEATWIVDWRTNRMLLSMAWPVHHIDPSLVGKHLHLSFTIISQKLTQAQLASPSRQARSLCFSPLASFDLLAAQSTERWKMEVSPRRHTTSRGRRRSVGSPDPAGPGWLPPVPFALFVSVASLCASLSFSSFTTHRTPLEINGWIVIDTSRYMYLEVQNARPEQASSFSDAR